MLILDAIVGGQEAGIDPVTPLGNLTGLDLNPKFYEDK